MNKEYQEEGRMANKGAASRETQGECPRHLVTYVSVLLTVIPAKAGIQSLSIKDKGFPITTSGMTISAFLSPLYS
jgi:hypothetical protein